MVFQHEDTSPILKAYLTLSCLRLEVMPSNNGMEHTLHISYHVRMLVSASMCHAAIKGKSARLLDLLQCHHVLPQCHRSRHQLSPSSIR